MKGKAFIAIATVVILSACGTATYKATDTSRPVVIAPANLQTAFNAQYPHATRVVWSNYNPVVVAPIDWDLAGFAAMDDNDYVVEFTQDGEYYYTWYHDIGKWVGSAYTLKDLSATPPAITGTIRNKYPFYIISTVTKEFKDNSITYEVELKNTQSQVKLLMDENGNIIKERTKLLE
ncbi:MAG TPA: PepSY-like domain-containing protein [Chitinophagaceae bacterium]|nr:PepSY-like domain-containing protein [Chitinophagaceae bacterium]